MDGQAIINHQLRTIDESITKFVDGMPAIERVVFERVLNLVKQLSLKNGTIENNVSNTKLISRINAELRDIIVNDKYDAKVKEFTSVFDKVSELNSSYFATVATNYKPAKVLDEIKKLNIETTISDLTENGLGSVYIDGVRDVLITNMTSGAKFSDLVTNMQDFIIGKGEEDGALVKYAKRITTDAINQYNGQYIKSVTDDLGLNWFMYVGSNLRTTRPFCKAMTEKLYFHKSEVPTILNGNIDGKKVSLAGLYDNTNSVNFFTLRGGYNCGHQIYPVLSAVVPELIRNKFAS